MGNRVVLGRTVPVLLLVASGLLACNEADLAGDQGSSEATDQGGGEGGSGGEGTTGGATDEGSGTGTGNASGSDGSSDGGSTPAGTGGASTGPIGGAPGEGGQSGANGSSGGGSGGMGSEGGTGTTGGTGSTPPDNRCSTHADCVLCTLPISDQTPCCDGCPAVLSQQQCAAEMAKKAQCAADRIALCPTVLCVFPGQPLCQGGQCVAGDGIEQ